MKSKVQAHDKWLLQSLWGEKGFIMVVGAYNFNLDFFQSRSRSRTTGKDVASLHLLGRLLGEHGPLSLVISCPMQRPLRPRPSPSFTRFQPLKN